MEAIDFWIWFNNQKKELENFLQSDFKDMSPYEILTEKATEFNEYIVPEITINKDNQFVLIISCDGMYQGISSVEKLFDATPHIENWIVKKFRQKGICYDFPVDGISFKKGEILVSFKEVPNTGKLLLDLYMKGYNENDERFDLASVVYLDHNIGEYNSMTKIYDINLKKLGWFTPRKKLISFQELTKIIEKM